LGKAAQKYREATQREVNNPRLGWIKEKKPYLTCNNPAKMWRLVFQPVPI